MSADPTTKRRTAQFAVAGQFPGVGPAIGQDMDYVTASLAARAFRERGIDAEVWLVNGCTRRRRGQVRSVRFDLIPCSCGQPRCHLKSVAILFEAPGPDNLLAFAEKFFAAAANLTAAERAEQAADGLASFDLGGVPMLAELVSGETPAAKVETQRTQRTPRGERENTRSANSANSAFPASCWRDPEIWFFLAACAASSFAFWFFSRR
jgi:hypothetical protein